MSSSYKRRNQLSLDQDSPNKMDTNGELMAELEDTLANAYGNRLIRNVTTVTETRAHTRHPQSRHPQSWQNFRTRTRQMPPEH